MKNLLDEKSENPSDNVFVVHSENIKVVNIKSFLTDIPFGKEEYYNYDLREPKRKIVNPDKIKETRKTVVSTQDWTNIPYYPTTREKRENVAKYLKNMGRSIPEKLMEQIKQDKKDEINEDAYNQPQHKPEQHQPKYHPQHQRPHHYSRQHYSQHQQTQQQPPPPQPPHKYSPQYATYIGAKPRAQPSAKIRLGGAYKFH